MSETNTARDPAIDEVRDARRRISARFDHDPARLGMHYMKLQEQYRDRLLTSRESPPSIGESAV